MADRRKKTKAGAQDKETTGKKPRSRKVRTEPPVSEAAPPPVESRPEEGTRPQPEQVPSDTPEPQNPASDGLRVSLPGELYRRQDQWWWRVQLPGEDKATARPLNTDGEETATEGGGDACGARTAAEKTALTMWEHAIEENATRRLRLESTEKIERLKAQFLDKVRHFTELVETANARVEAEQRARAAAEAKLAQMIQAAGSVPQNKGQAAPKERPPATPTRAQAPVVARPVAVETGLCECCDATGIAMTHLTRIDSGQWLCPRCLAAFRTDATRSA